MPLFNKNTRDLHMNEKKFDPKKLQKLNNPERLKDIPPDYIRGKLRSEAADVMIEIGAGTAFFSIAFLPIFKPTTIYACDISDVMLHWVTENVSSTYPAIIPLKTKEDSVPLDGGVADLIYMINLHHELDSPSMTLKESFRLLKPDSEIFIVDWKKEKMVEGPPERIRCSPEEVKTQLISSGFSDVTDYDELKKHFLVTGRKL